MHIITKITLIHGRFVLSASFKADLMTLFPIRLQILGRNDKRCHLPQQLHEKQELNVREPRHPRFILRSLSFFKIGFSMKAELVRSCNSVHGVFSFCKIDCVYLLHLQ